MKYCYGMKLRGFSVGCQPMNGLIGVTQVDMENNSPYWDILTYNRKLTDKEIEEYELEYIEAGCGEVDE